MRFLKAITILVLISLPTLVFAKVEKKPNTRTKFYNFDAVIIDGEVKKPTGLYTDARKRVQFERLLDLKKSFMGALMETSKDPVFK